MINTFLKKESIDGFFIDVLGADVHKSKVTKIKMLLDKYKVHPKDAVFITDTLGDVLEANECGVPSIAVTWGLHEKETLSKGNPAKIIENPLFLIEAVKEILN
jgi:phosphoglycolate phosphatase